MVLDMFCSFRMFDCYISIFFYLSLPFIYDTTSLNNIALVFTGHAHTKDGWILDFLLNFF